ncbi:MAG: glutathione S-transferase family protein [Pseudomonadota bacterium]|nr:glutathione S-transferase family protein [Pseudomonadota bacterium]
MSALTLYIGDKNLSSWSLRPWLILKQAGIPFTEKMIRLGQPTTRSDILDKSPNGLVPCLVDGDVTVWDSLAIAEYLAEMFPEKNLWPQGKAARAEARAVSAEMHSGFASLRTVWPMVFSREGMRHIQPDAVRKDVARIVEIWSNAREKFGSQGPFLFGAFSIADAMYAPVVSRFVTYGPIDLPKPAAEWRDMMFALPAMKEWGAAAKAEVGA